jgi:hypothetical protein
VWLQAAKLLKASILKVDVSDLEMDEEEFMADMAAHRSEDDPDFADMMHQHNVQQEEQPEHTAAAAAAAAADNEEDVDMMDAADQQENVPPPSSQQPQQGKQPVQQAGKQQVPQTGRAQQEQPEATPQQRKSTSISAEKYEFVKVRPSHCSHPALLTSSRKDSTSICVMLHAIQC